MGKQVQFGVIIGVVCSIIGTSSMAQDRSQVQLPLQSCTGAYSKNASMAIKGSGTPRLHGGASPFFCVNVRVGGAQQQPVQMMFDTGGNAMIIPKACLTPGSFTPVAGAPATVKDPWGNDASVVQGDVSLVDANGKEVMTLQNFQFLAGTEGSCETGFKNFGAGFDFYILPSSKQPQLKTKVPGAVVAAKAQTQKLPPSAAEGTWDGCLLSYFAFAQLQNPQQAAYGFETDYVNSVLKLTLGPLPDNGAQSINLQGKAPRSCSGLNNAIEYVGQFDSTWSGITADGFGLTIDGQSINPQQSSNGKIMMVDSGGGMMLISDDANQTIAQQFVSSGKASLCQTISWLKNCFCLNAGLNVTVSSLTVPAINYSYTTGDVTQSISTAVAICPPWGYDRKNPDPNPYMTPNGFNPGAQLFENIPMGFDFKNGKVIFKPKSQLPSN